MPEDKKAPKGPHTIILEDRRNLSITGVTDIDSFDEDNLDVDSINKKIGGNSRALRLDREELKMNDSDEDELEDLDSDINEEAENRHHLRPIALALFFCSKHGTNIP